MQEQLLLQVADVPLTHLQQVLRTLAERQQITVGHDGYRIRHDLIREAVYQVLLPSQRRRLHTRYAEALSGEPEATAALAAHWLEAEEPALALSAA